MLRSLPLSLALPLALALLSLAPCSLAASSPPPAVLRLAVFDTSTNPAGVFFFKQFSQAVAVQFVIAANHFNGRRTDLVPALANLTSCSSRISIERLCNTAAQGDIGMGSAIQLNGSIDAIVGVPASVELIPLGQLATTLKIPIVNHWASSPQLDDRNLYPLVARTGQDDGAYAGLLVQLIMSLNYTKAVLFYQAEDPGPSFSLKFTTLALNFGLIITSISFSYSNPANFEQAVAQIAATRLSTIVYYGIGDPYLNGGPLPALANKYNLTSRLWIWTNFNIWPQSSDLLGNPDLQKLFVGSLLVPNVLPDNARMAHYLSLWTSEFPLYVSQINSIFPPHGNTPFDCLHDNLNYSLPPGFFSQETRSMAFPVWAYAYDAVMALGIASCYATAQPWDSHALFQALMKVDFAGLSGRVRFDTTTGGRYARDFGIGLATFAYSSSNKTFVFQTIGQYNGTNANWILSLNSSTLPAEVIPAAQDYNYLPFGMVILGGVLLAVILLATAVCTVWLLLHWRDRVVTHAQPIFLSLSLLGIAVSSISILGFTSDDNPNQSQLFAPAVGCNFAICTYFVGLTFSLSMLGLKLFRIYSMFTPSRKWTMHFGAPLRDILLAGMMYVCLDLLFIGLWQGLAPMGFKRTVLTYDALDQPTSSTASCSVPSGMAVGFLTVCAVFLLAALVFALQIAWMSITIDIPKELNDASNVALGLLGVLQIYAIGIPVRVALQDSVVGNFVTVTLIVFFSDLMLLAVVFIPLMLTKPPKLESSGEVRPASSQAALSVEEGLRIPRVRDRFVKFAQDRYIIENVLFIIDVAHFKEEFQVQEQSRRIKTAHALTEVYIRNDALLQVNVSGEVRNAIESKVKTGAVTVDLFDRANDDISQLLNLNGWLLFVNEGGLHGFAPSGAEVEASAHSTPAQRFNSVRKVSTAQSQPQRSPSFQEKRPLSHSSSIKDEIILT